MRGPWPKGVGLYGLLGAVLVAGGSFLPWISRGGRSVNAWNMPVLPMLPWFRTAGGAAIGFVLLVVVVLLVPYVLRRPLPAIIRLIVAGVVFNIAGGVVITVLHAGAGASPGIGVILALAGAILMVVGDGGVARQKPGGSGMGADKGLGSCVLAIIAVVVFGVCPMCALASGIPPEKWIEELGDDSAPAPDTRQAVVGPAPAFVLPAQQSATPTPQQPQPQPQQSQSSNPPVSPPPKATPSSCTPSVPNSLTTSSGTKSGGSNGNGGSWTITGAAKGNVNISITGMKQCGTTNHHTMRVTVNHGPPGGSNSFCNPTMGSSISQNVTTTTSSDTISVTVTWDSGCQ